jgi:hypothetical protein
VNIDSSFRSAGFLVTVSAALAYVTGFVVVNSALIEVGGAGFELLSLRFGAAAILFWLLTGLPCAIGLVFWVEFASLKDEHGGRLAKFITAFLVTVIVGFGIWAALLQLMSQEVDVGTRRLPVYYFLVPFIVGLVLRASWRRSWPPSLAQWHVITLFRAVVWLGVFIASLVVFGREIYPRVNPVVGGGAAWLAAVELTVQQNPNIPQKSTVAVMDRSAGMYRLITCSADGIQYFVLPESSIAAVELRGYVHPGVFVEMCADTAQSVRPGGP